MSETQDTRKQNKIKLEPIKTEFRVDFMTDGKKRRNRSRKYTFTADHSSRLPPINAVSCQPKTQQATEKVPKQQQKIRLPDLFQDKNLNEPLPSKKKGFLPSKDKLKRVRKHYENLNRAGSELIKDQSSDRLETKGFD